MPSSVVQRPARERAILALLALGKTKYPVRRAANSLEPKFSVALRAAFAVARKKLPDVDATVKALAKALALVVPGLLLAGLKKGGEAASMTLKISENFRTATKQRAQLHMVFDASNPRVAKWAERHAAELIAEVTKTTKGWIREAAAAHAEGQLDDAEYHAALQDAVGDPARAQTIARTESMTAVHEGQREAWRQAVGEGLLDEGARRTWIVTPDDRLCPICEPLDGERADLDGEYPGGFEAPPAHPNCRCTEGLA